MILLRNGVDSSQKDTFASIAGEQVTEKASARGGAVISAKQGTIPACATGNKDRMGRNVTHFSLGSLPLMMRSPFHILFQLKSGGLPCGHT